MSNPASSSPSDRDLCSSSGARAPEALDAPIQVISAEEFRTVDGLFVHLKRQISQASQNKDIVCLNLEPHWGTCLADSLIATGEVEARAARVSYNTVEKTLRARVMPTEIHDCHQEWLHSAMFEWVESGVMSFHEVKAFSPRVGTTIKNFLGPFEGSRKEPDLMIRPDHQEHPSIVFESGWSESGPYLERDLGLWTSGTTDVNVVILLIWRKLSGQRVKGTVEVYTRDYYRRPVKSQEAPVFPVPDDGQRNLYISRGELFGTHLLPNTRDSALLPLNLDRLRELATASLRFMGLRPA